MSTITATIIPVTDITPKPIDFPALIDLVFGETITTALIESGLPVDPHYSFPIAPCATTTQDICELSESFSYKLDLISKFPRGIGMNALVPLHPERFEAELAMPSFDTRIIHEDFMVRIKYNNHYGYAYVPIVFTIGITNHFPTFLRVAGVEYDPSFLTPDYFSYVDDESEEPVDVYVAAYVNNDMDSTEDDSSEDGCVSDDIDDVDM